jgi:integrase
VQVSFFLKRPGSGRTSFSIVRRETLANGKRTHTLVEQERVSATNAAPMSQADKDLQLSALCRKLNEDERRKTQGTYIASEANLKLLSTYWKSEYEHRKVQKEQAYNRLKAAIDVLGPVSLLVDRASLQKHVDRNTAGAPSKQRKVVAVLNQMRRHFGIADKLSAEKPSFPEFRYLTAPEFRLAVEYVEGPTLRLLFTVLFYSGVRTGEAMALRKEHYKNGALLVMSQVDRKGKLRGTKTLTQRRTAVFHAGQPAMREWLGLPLDRREAACRNSLSRIWKRACMKAFPRDESKWTCVHDLRHSYAVAAVTEHNVHMPILAKLLGNSASVCETYYLRFTLSDDLVAGVLARASHA